MSQLRLSLITTPRSLWLCEVLMGVSLILYGVEVLQFSDIWMLLEELNDIWDVALQEDKLSM